MIINVTTTEQFEQEIAQGTVLVDFYSQTCSPCRMLATHLEMMDQEQPELKMLKIDAHEVVELASKYNVTSVPTVMKFVDGELQDMFVGARPKDFMLEWLGE